LAKVRIRGIYATALTKLLMERGHEIVQPSEKIARRFNVVVDNSPSDVTVKDSDDGDGVIIVGFPRETREVFNELSSSIPYVFKCLSRIELHSVYLARVVESRGDECVVETGDFKAGLSPCKRSVGDKVIVGVRRTPLYPGERVVLSEVFRLTGKLVALVHGSPRITFSEHIRDSELRARLTTLAASRLMGSGLGIHFRSSSRFASQEEILGEIDRLLDEYRRLMTIARDAEPPLKLFDGELVGVISFTSLAKSLLDDVRSTVAPTIRGHHSLRSVGLGDLVEAVEYCILQGCSREAASRGLQEYLLDKLLEEPVIHIRHVKPTGEAVELTPGRVEKIVREEGLTKIVVKRVISGHGAYDGLGVEKKPGDVDYMVVTLGEPYVIHNYYRDKTWLGSYINVNTPPEVSYNLVKYHDLLVDVAVHPTGEIRVLDREELDNAYRQGLIDEKLYEYALRAVDKLLRNPPSHLYNLQGVIQ